jgi:NAD-dependent deacetylase
MSDFQALAHHLKKARSAVAFTGAGISTESGIPDFRSPSGVWSKHKPVMYDEFVASREARIRYWKMRTQLYAEFENAQPNAGHRALAQLERAGRITAVITQNIDGLHQVAGSRRVIELHGTARVIACIECGIESTPAEIVVRLQTGEEAPDCEDCGAPLKSKTISFGQPMPITEMQDASQLARHADLFLAIGSSLVVEPAASLPRLAYQHGATLVIINNAPTPLDPLAALIIRDPIGVTLDAVSGHISYSDPGK